MNFRELLQAFDLKTLFITELGWDRYVFPKKELEQAGSFYPTSGIAQKRGMAVIAIDVSVAGLPSREQRQTIDKYIGSIVREHIIVYLDKQNKKQLWQWVWCENNQPVRYREHSYHNGQSGDSLMQKLQHLAFSIDEEDDLVISTVARRARQAFDVDRVTKQFYERFQKEHAIFLTFINGLSREGDAEWYASVMLNRLMFIYFMQRKGFLDGDREYLRNRLNSLRHSGATGEFLSFYRFFLIRLFHEALGAEARDPELEKLVGKVPYLNGGLFDVHELESAEVSGRVISIPDAAFERIFDFFDQYQWHLDERPLHADNEINPDVLGYIFEKYVNQKQMGAYYTKEDITGYIGRSVLLPSLFDSVRFECASRPELLGDAIYSLLKQDPDRYMFRETRYGFESGVVINAGEKPVPPMPATVIAGIAPDSLAQLVTDGPVKSVRLRSEWNRVADVSHALPTETWRDVIYRKQDYDLVRAMLVDEKVLSIDAMVTLNLDLQQFSQDVIDQVAGPALIMAFWKALTKLTVLDPTCGSGAFLFAALNILEPLYEACIERMESFLREENLSDDIDSATMTQFKDILKRVDSHPNRRYFNLKTIILKNLYGVDIMDEAVEICKLRLFLKLASQIEPRKEHINFGIEPLPDIDFNIRTGNALVGYATFEEARAAIRNRLDFDNVLEQVTKGASELQVAFDSFKSSQIDTPFSVVQKQILELKLSELEELLNRYLAKDYGVNPLDTLSYASWKESHRPLHWFLTFHGIVNFGGFQAVIGNPPYLEYSRVKGYKVFNLSTLKTANLYAFVLERSLALVSSQGRVGEIVPISLACSGAMSPLRDCLEASERSIWLSHFSNRPGQLFVGAQNRLTIVILSAKSDHMVNRKFSSRYYRWDARGGAREQLFPTLKYHEINARNESFHGLLPKVGSALVSSVLSKINSSRTIGHFASKNGDGIYWVRVPGYFCIFLLEPPMAHPEKGGKPRLRGEVNSISFENKLDRAVVHAVLNSSLYYLFFCVYTDTRHINPSNVSGFPFDLATFKSTTKVALSGLSAELTKSFRKNTSHWRKSGLLIDSVDARPCKPVIDRIDQVLACHYGFTEEELDYILNYDIKFRIGNVVDEDD